jgi:hypothetical protein
VPHEARLERVLSRKKHNYHVIANNAEQTAPQVLPSLSGTTSTCASIQLSVNIFLCQPALQWLGNLRERERAQITPRGSWFDPEKQKQRRWLNRWLALNPLRSWPFEALTKMQPWLAKAPIEAEIWRR